MDMVKRPLKGESYDYIGDISGEKSMFLESLAINAILKGITLDMLLFLWQTIP